MVRKKDKYISYNFEITLEARSRLVASRGQIADYMIISIKMVVQVVVLNFITFSAMILDADWSIGFRSGAVNLISPL